MLRQSRCQSSLGLVRGAGLRRARVVLAVVCLPWALAACAPGAWKPNAPANAFLDKIQRNCGTARIGELTVYQLLNGPLESAYFMDVSTQFSSGRIGEEAYIDAISSTFNTVRTAPGIRCVVAQKAP